MYFTILTVFFLTSSIYCKDITVTIENGQVKGQVVQFRNKTIHVFKGIRYGKPPTGHMRYKRPEKAEKWTHVYDATTEKSECWQIKLNPKTRKLSEDCLFVNVWSHDNSTQQKSVMVWFYGGGLQTGSIWGNLFNALPIATLDVVVVTVNYRVGPWGFLYGGNDDAPGNVGLYDQLLALNWVQENIHVFGGNKDDVTIFGESAGGWSVSFHIVSPLSKGLFKKGIIQSGTIFTEKSFTTKNDGVKIAKKYAFHFGCKNESNWIKCLKQIDPLKLNNFTNNLDSYLPVVGEAFYPMTSFDAVKTGRFNSEVKILAGVNADEGSTYVARWFINLNSSSPNFKQNAINILDGQMRKWKYLDSDSNRKKVINFYLANVTEIDMIKNRIGQVFGDYLLTCPTYYMAKDVMLWSGNSKVYFYKLTHHSRVSLSHRVLNESWIGTGHADDLEYVFGLPFSVAESYTEQDRNFSLLIMNLWTNFAKTGDPMNGNFNGINLPGINLSNISWPSIKKVSFTKTDTNVMELNPLRFGTLLHEPFKTKCDQLWRSILKV